MSARTNASTVAPGFGGLRRLLSFGAMAQAPPLTRNQAIVLDALRAAERPLSAYQIMDITTPQGVRAPQQVYRALEGLIDHRLIHRIETLNAYLCCDHAPHAEQVAFAVCTNCGHVEEMPLARLMTGLKRAARARGFALTSAHVELSGLCKDCQARGSDEARSRRT